MTRYSKQECGVYVGKKLKDAITKWIVIDVKEKSKTATVKNTFGSVIKGVPFSRIIELSKKFGTWE